jgi:hypothetical protein
MYVTCINTMVSVEIGYSASRPDNSKEMYQLANLFKICIISVIEMNPDTFRIGEIKNERLLNPSDFC